ncbi:MAG: hypothetical protein Fur005_23280 [Roseiflexaceae bacterium]
MHELLQELRQLLDSYPGEVLIGEDEDVRFHGSHNDELHLVFNFPLMRTERFSAEHVYRNQAERLAALPPGAWPCNTLGNHDAPRLLSRYGDGVHDQQLARLNAAMLLMLKGTPFLYNGEEIGMADLVLAELEQLRDTAAIYQYQTMVSYQGVAPADALQAAIATTRGRCRSPMQWDGSAHAGFCPAEVTPWLPVHANSAAGVHVAAQQADPTSLLQFYRGLLRVRRENPALHAGEYRPLSLNPVCLVFVREDASSGQQCLVALNYTDQPQPVPLGRTAQRTLFSNARSTDLPLQLEALQLAAWEVLVVELAEV